MPDLARGDHKLHLVVNGRAWYGWKEARIQRGIEHCSGGFELGLSELWHDSYQAPAVRMGDRCDLMIGTETVIAGWVDTVQVSLDAGAHSTTVEGRDAVGDLVDCSAIRRSGQWRGLRIEQVASEIAAPFGVRVTTDVDTGKPLTSFALQEGETAFEAIERAARLRALLLVSDGAGGLRITRAGDRRISTELVMGENIAAIAVRTDGRDRFSEYVAKGQAPGSDFFNGTAASQIKARAVDPGVTRYRPMLITDSSPDIAATLAQRAQWEANVRAARSFEAEVAVQGWRHADGLWEPNTRVMVRAPEVRLEAELLISRVVFSLDERGTRSVLSLTRPDAFSLLPLRQADAAASFWAVPKAATQ